MAELRARVSSAFQHPITHPSANMLSFNILIHRAKMWLQLPTSSLTFNSRLFSGATSFSAGVAATMQSCLAHTEALRRLNITLMADTYAGVVTASTGDWDATQASSTGASVANLVAGMTT